MNRGDAIEYHRGVKITQKDVAPTAKGDFTGATAKWEEREHGSLRSGSKHKTSTVLTALAKRYPTRTNW